MINSTRRSFLFGLGALAVAKPVLMPMSGIVQVEAPKVIVPDVLNLSLLNQHGEDISMLYRVGKLPLEINTDEIWYLNGQRHIKFQNMMFNAIQTQTVEGYRISRNDQILRDTRLDRVYNLMAGDHFLLKDIVLGVDSM